MGTDGGIITHTGRRQQYLLCLAGGSSTYFAWLRHCGVHRQSVQPQQRKKQHIMETSATDSTAVTTPHSAASTRTGTSRTSSGHRRAAAPSCSGRDRCHCHHSWTWTRRCAGGAGSSAARLGRPRSGGHRSMDTRRPPMGPPGRAPASKRAGWSPSLSPLDPGAGRAASASVGRSPPRRLALFKWLEAPCAVLLGWFGF